MNLKRTKKQEHDAKLANYIDSKKQKIPPEKNKQNGTNPKKTLTNKNNPKKKQKTQKLKSPPKNKKKHKKLTII